MDTKKVTNQMDKSAWSITSSFAGSPRAELSMLIVKQAGLTEAHAAIFYHGVRMCRPEGYILHSAVKEVRKQAIQLAMAHKYKTMTPVEFAWVLTDHGKMTWIVGAAKDHQFSEEVLASVRRWASHRKVSTVKEWTDRLARLRDETKRIGEHYRKQLELHNAKGV